MASIAQQKFYLQREVTPGVAVINAMRDYAALKVTPGFNDEGETYRRRGLRGVTAHTPTIESATLAVESPQCFNALAPILASVIGEPVTTQPSVGTAPTAYQHVFTLTGHGERNPVTFTGHWGDSDNALQLAYLAFQSLTLGVQRSALSFETSAIAREPDATVALATGVNEVQTISSTGPPTAGTFTLSFNGQTTAAIAYNAAASAIQTALEALSTIGSGNVAASGGPLPGTAVPVTFQGNLAGQNVATMTVDNTGLTGGTVAIATTTPGVPITTIPAKPVPARAYDVYMDDTEAAWGTTKMLKCYDMNLSVGDTWGMDTPINSAIVSYDSLLENEDVEFNGSAQFGFDATARALITTFKNGAMKYTRTRANGPIIGGAITYSVQIDYPIIITGRGEMAPAPNSPTVVLPFNYGLQADPVTDVLLKVTLINTVATI